MQARRRRSKQVNQMKVFCFIWSHNSGAVQCSRGGMSALQIIQALFDNKAVTMLRPYHFGEWEMLYDYDAMCQYPSDCINLKYFIKIRLGKIDLGALQVIFV